jgi:hypothetical protein
MPALNGALNLHGTAVLNGDGTRSAPALVERLALHLLDDILTFDDLSENDVLAVEVGSADKL